MLCTVAAIRKKIRLRCRVPLTAKISPPCGKVTSNQRRKCTRELCAPRLRGRDSTLVLAI